MARPPFDVNVIDKMTPAVVAQGHRILQTHRFSDDDEEHVARLLEALDPPHGAVILDNGCGIGEVSLLMAKARSDTSYVLANISQVQLDMCPSGAQFGALLCDSHKLPLPPACVHAVMFSSSLAQMDEAVALAEAYRVLRPGGKLLLNELVRTYGDGAELERVLACRALTFPQLLSAVELAGFEVRSYIWPRYDDSHFRELLAADGLERLGRGLKPILLTATKRSAS